MRLQKRILVIGSLNMDQVTRVHKTPKVGETVMGSGLHLNPGGKGANQAVAMGKLGAHVTMIGQVGDDASGEALKANLEAMHVIDKVGVVKNEASGTAIIMVNDDADNSIVVIEGANGKLTPDMVKEEWFDDVEIVVAQLEVPYETVKRAFQLAKKRNIMTVLNPAPAKQLDAAFMQEIDLLVVNETEFEVVTGRHWNNTDDLVWAHGHHKLNSVLLTLGKRGAYYFDGIKFSYCAAHLVDAVDTTAAGDSFIGGVLSEFALGKTVEESMEYATLVAAYTVTKIGAQSALPTREALDVFKQEVIRS